MSKVTTAIVEITPEQAAQWLATANTHNRTIRESKVAAYARDMEGGAWAFNGDTIRFAQDGTLIDGQHRLAAIVRCGIPCTFIVVFGLEPEAQDTIDIGAHRLLRDQLILAGHANSKELAAIARRVMAYERNRGVPGSNFSPTNAEMIAYIEANKDIHRSAEVASHANARRSPTAPSVIGAAYHLCAKRSVEQADDFWVRQVVDCIGLSEHSPARALLTRLQNEMTLSGRQMPPDNAFRYCLLAWNLFRSGARVSKLQAPKGGWNSENVPEAR